MNNSPTARTHTLHLGLIVLSVFAAHWGMLRHGFVWDDEDMRAWISLRGPWRVLDADPFGFVRPGKTFLFSLLDWIFGPRPAAWETVSLAATISASAAVYFFALRWMGSRAALLAACIYGVHPLHVEGAGWISSLNGTFLTLAALGYYTAALNAARSPRLSLDLAAFVLFLGAFAMKEEAVVLPFAAILFLRSKGLAPTRLTLGLMAIQLGLAAIFIVYARHEAARAGQMLEPFPYAAWIVSLTYPRVLLSHFLYFCFPFHWAYYHYFDPRPIPFFAAFSLGWIAALAFAMALAKRKIADPGLRVFLLFSILALLPASNLIPAGNNWFGVRYLSHAGVGLALAGARLFELAWTRVRARPLCGAAVLVWLASAIICSNIFHRSWGSSEIFFTKMVQAELDSPFTYNLANIRLKQNHPAEALNLIHVAVANYPDRVSFRVTQGIALWKLGRKEEARQEWEGVLKNIPGNIDAAVHLGVYHEERYSQTHDAADREAAERYYAAAARGSGPNAEVAFNRLGMLWIADSRPERAAEIWQAGLKKFPLSQTLQHNLDLALKSRNRQP